VRRKRGWGYLFAVIDAFDREIVGWAFSLRCTTDILLEAVDMALNYRFPHRTRDQDLTIRSDNGCQMFKPNVLSRCCATAA
jgi:putative transposase